MSTPPVTSSDDQVRLLATQINQPPYNFDPTTIRKAVIQSIDLGSASTPPTATILFSGDTSSPVAGVRLAADYAPNVGDTVIVLKQAADFFILTDVANAGSITAGSTVGGWTQATLNAAHSHNGNANGSLMYRRILEQGCWKMQWKGSIVYGGGTPTVLSAALAAEFRPTEKRSLTVAREVATGGGVAIGVDFNTDGTVSIVAPLWVSSASGSANTGADGNFSVGTHNHGIPFDLPAPDAHNHFGSDDAGGSFSVGTHTHTMAHTHTAANPTWISFNQHVEYFL